MIAHSRPREHSYNGGVPSTLTLLPGARRAFDRLATDCRRVFGDRFEALVAYDVDRAAIFATRVGAADLGALTALVEVWHKDGLRTPLVMTSDEFHRSLDAFPLEYQAIADRHVLIAGADPFAGVQVQPEDLRRACEVHAKAHLIHLRQGWLDTGGAGGAIAELIAESSTPWRVLIENVARLRGIDLDDRAALTAWTSSVTAMPRELCEALFDLERDAASGPALVGRLPEYVAGAERLWATIDSWRL